MRGKLTVKASYFDEERPRRRRAPILSSTPRPFEGHGAISTLGGAGIGLTNIMGAETRGKLTMTSSLIDDAQSAGIELAGTDAKITGTVIRGTVLFPATNGSAGVYATVDPTSKQQTALEMTDCLVEKNYGLGVLVEGADITFTHSESSKNLPRAMDGFFGRGMQIELYQDGGYTLRLDGRRHDLRLPRQLRGRHHDLRCASVREAGRDHPERRRDRWTTSSATQWPFTVRSSGPTTTLEVATVQLTNNDRAGVAAFASKVGLTSATILCNAFDLSADAVDGHVATFQDLGGNVCGCGKTSKACVALSANLSPPTLPPTMKTMGM